jgi:hypothetical protein
MKWNIKRSGTNVDCDPADDCFVLYIHLSSLAYGGLKDKTTRTIN